MHASNGWFWLKSVYTNVAETSKRNKCSPFVGKCTWQNMKLLHYNFFYCRRWQCSYQQTSKYRKDEHQVSTKCPSLQTLMQPPACSQTPWNSSFRTAILVSLECIIVLVSCNLSYFSHISWKLHFLQLCIKKFFH